MVARELDALRRVRVAGQEVEALVGLGIDRHEAAVSGHRIQEPSRRIGIVARFSEHANADDVCLQLLLARESGQSELAASQSLLSGNIAGQHLGNDAAGDNFRFLTLLPFDAVVCRDVAHLMRENGSDLGCVVCKCQQAARYIEIAARQGKGVDSWRIQDGDAVGLARIFGDGRQRACDTGNQALGLCVLVLATVAGNDARMLARAHGSARIVLLHLIDDLRIGGWRNAWLIGLLRE